MRSFAVHQLRKFATQPLDTCLCCSCLVWLVYQHEKLHHWGLLETAFSLLWSANAIPCGKRNLICLVFVHQILRWQEFFAGDLVKALHTVNIRSFSDTKHSIASQRDAEWKLWSCSLRKASENTGSWTEAHVTAIHISAAHNISQFGVLRRVQGFTLRRNNRCPLSVNTVPCPVFWKPWKPPVIKADLVWATVSTRATWCRRVHSVWEEGHSGGVWLHWWDNNVKILHSV